MSEIKPAEVSAILKKQLAEVDLEVKLEEVGTVLTVGDGIARVYGLNNVQAGELVLFNTGEQGIVHNLEEDNVGAVLLGSDSFVKEGDTVKSVKFYGGCNGNTKGVGALVEGMKVEEVISRLKGIKCGMRPTSCPDQLARALEQTL